MRKIGGLEMSPIGIGCMGFSHGHRGSVQVEGSKMSDWGKD